MVGALTLFLALASSIAPSVRAADPAKVLHITFQAAETGFDPVKVSDYYSGTVIEAIFEPLLTYDYLARPAKIVPNTAESMPEVTDNGKTYTFRVKKGIYFTPDPAFKGKPRELTAADYAYAIKRFLDPANRSPYAFLFEGKIVGLDELAARAKQSGRFDYDARVPGIELPDRYTLRIRLAQTDYGFAHIMAFELSGGVAREVIETYGADTNSHPVGTGPYRLAKYVRSSKITLEANPDYRARTWDFAPGEEADKAMVERMKGNRMPLIGAVEISILEEAQSRWLAFERGDSDMEYQLSELAANFMTEDGKLKPEYAKRGIQLDRSVDPEIIYTHFNMQEKIGDEANPLGGFAKERIALRRAIALAWKIDDQIRIIRKGQAIKAEYPIPPGVGGHEPGYRSILQYDPATANALLDKFGYKKGADGYRTQPGGKPLIIRYASMPNERDRQFDELVKRSLDSIGLRMEIQKGTFAELIKQMKQCRLMLHTAAWIADYPDGDNFMQLLYGPNSGQSNNGCYRSSEYDKLYEASRKLPDGPERNKLYRDMTRLMEVHTAWRLLDSRYRNELLQPWVVGFKTHPVLRAVWQYMDIDLDKKSKR
ncbi:MAG TPA: ABC transporter substrate-binding protein [Burkholderiales bacterium]|nr:ABC transporter substrate-binding protein [Burkholderiales bacterium]